MTTRIMIDRCYPDHGRVSRATDAEIEALAVSIRDGGMKHPILVIPSDLGNYIVVDGLNRIKAASKLGLVTIEATVTENLEQACRLLEKANAKQDVLPYRVWEISRAVEPLLLKRRDETVKLRKSGNTGPRLTGMELIAKALRVRNGQWLKILRELYRMAEEVEATEIMSKVDTGELSVHSARPIMKRLAQGATLQQPATPAATKDQLLLLGNVSRNLGTTLKALQGAVESLVVTPEELAPIVSDLRKHRTLLYRIVHIMEKEVKDV